jgi:hypothetical protein
MFRVCNVFFHVQIAQIQLHALAVSALLLQERGHPAPVPAVYIYKCFYSGEIYLNNKYFISKAITQATQPHSASSAHFLVQTAQIK